MNRRARRCRFRPLLPLIFQTDRRQCTYRGPVEGEEKTGASFRRRSSSSAPQVPLPRMMPLSFSVKRQWSRHWIPVCSKRPHIVQSTRKVRTTAANTLTKSALVTRTGAALPWEGARNLNLETMPWSIHHTRCMFGAYV